MSTPSPTRRPAVTSPPMPSKQPRKLSHVPLLLHGAAEVKAPTQAPPREVPSTSTPALTFASGSVSLLAPTLPPPVVAPHGIMRLPSAPVGVFCEHSARAHQFQPRQQLPYEQGGFVAFIKPTGERPKIFSTHSRARLCPSLRCGATATDWSRRLKG